MSRSTTKKRISTSSYSGLKKVWGPRTNATTQLKAADGQTIITDHQIFNHWTEHLHLLLLDVVDVSVGTLGQIPQIPELTGSTGKIL